MPIGQAAAAQVVAVATTLAYARERLRNGFEKHAVVNAMATSAVNVCALALADNDAIGSEEVFGVTSTVRLVYNSSQVKLTAVSVLSACRALARNELEYHAISNAMGSRTEMLSDICSSIVGEHSLEPVWCALVLVVYLSSHPRGRDLLRDSQLTDVDVQAAIATVRYGGEEINRRNGAQKKPCKQPSAPKRARSCDASSSSSGHSVDGGEEEGDWQDECDGEDQDESVYPFLDTPRSSPVTLPTAKPPGKRKRAPRGSGGAVTSEAHVLLNNWHAYLNGPHVSVLNTLAAHNKRTARDAALCTLAQQAEGTEVATNEMLKEASLRNAERSAVALVAMVGRRESDVPGVLALRARDHVDGPYTTAIALQRIDKEAASTALHACTLPPRAVRPPASTGIAVAWSVASQRLMPKDECHATLPGILDRMYEVQRLRTQSDGEVRGRSVQAIGLMEAFIRAETDAPMLTEAAGTTRSFISLRAEVPINTSHDKAARALVDEAHAAAARCNADAAWPAVESFPSLQQTSKCSDSRYEPVCTPVPALAVGIYANECIRRWMARKTRKNDPCIKHLGFSVPSELSRDVPSIMSSEPSPMLTITDFDIELPRETLWERMPGDKLSTAEAAVGLHVCGEGATRLPELLEAMVRKPGLDAAAYAMQARAALFVAASQASFVSAVGSALSAGYTNVAVASSKKISVRRLPAPQSCNVRGRSGGGPSCCSALTTHPWRRAGSRRQQTVSAVADGRVRGGTVQCAALLRQDALLGHLRLSRRHGVDDARAARAQPAQRQAAARCAMHSNAFEHGTPRHWLHAFTYGSAPCVHRELRPFRRRGE